MERESSDADVADDDAADDDADGTPIGSDSDASTIVPPAGGVAAIESDDEDGVIPLAVLMFGNEEDFSGDDPATV